MELEGVPLSHVEQNLTIFLSFSSCKGWGRRSKNTETHAHNFGTDKAQKGHLKLWARSLLITLQCGTGRQLAINVEQRHARLHPRHLHQQNQDRASASLIHHAEALLISQVRCFPSAGMSVQLGVKGLGGNKPCSSNNRTQCLLTPWPRSSAES